VDVEVEMLALSQSVIVELVLGLDPDRDARGLMPALRAVVEAVNRNTFPSLAELFLPVPTPKVAALERAIAALDPILMALVAERRASHVGGDDMLSAMIRMSEDPGRGRPPMTDVELRDEVITMISAGHETIGNALTWTWLLLAQHPDAAARMHAELDRVLAGRLPTLQDLPALPFVEAVLKESMRLYPPVWVVARKTPGEWTLGDYVVPAGAYLQVCPWVTQRDPTYFDDAGAFKPERWLTSDAGARYKGAYFPFAAGSHRCIGESLAWTEGILALATLAQQWSLELVRPGYTVQPEAAITLRPKGGLPMTLRARTGALAAA
jgi:cytochrome P450